MSFRFKIALLTASFAALPLLVVGWLLIDLNARELESSTQALQIMLCDEVASSARRDVEDADRALLAVADMLSDPTVAEDARIPLALRLLDAEPGLDTIGIYDAEGALIDRMSAPGSSAPETPERLERALLERATAGLAVEPAVLTESVVYAPLVRPIRASERVTGFVYAPLNLSRLEERVARLSAQLASREGALYVIDDQRRALSHPDPLARLDEVTVALESSLDMRDLTRAPVSGERVAADGRSLLSTAVGVGDPPWAVVAQIPLETAYAPLDTMRAIVVSTIAIALLAAFVAAFVFARQMTAPIDALVAFSKELAARRFEKRVALDSKDELGVLARAMSDAAAELEKSEERLTKEAAIRHDLGRYLPAELVEKVILREQSMALGGERCEVTVMFADVVAFTPLTEQLSPEQVVGLLNELFTLLTEAVFRHGGTVDKFVGDCVMAVFGAPRPAEDHAARAIMAARDMLRFLESANPGFRDRYGTEVQLAIGVNTGVAVVGNVGSTTRMEYTAIGDVVNVAARLESIARPQQLLVSRSTKDAIGDAFDLVPVGERVVPGRAAPVELFEVRW